MTLGVLWVRNAGPDMFELCVASDSRLTGGTAWDCAQKVFPLPRGDCALAFAGDTTHAYPLVTQTVNYVLSYERAQSRALDLGSFKGHLGRVIERMRMTLVDVEFGNRVTCDLLLVGYDWRTSNFKAWRLALGESGESQFQRVPNMGAQQKRPRDGWRFHFYGDDNAALDATQRVLGTMRAKSQEIRQLDMEPFSVLTSIINERKYHSIGGAPQLVKVYRHMNCMPYNVRWPRPGSAAFLLGRELLSYETNRFLVMNPETYETTPWPNVVHPDCGDPDQDDA
jgi:hypothetical protein